MFVGEGRGYAVGEGSEVEIAIHLQRFVPFVSFTTHPIASVSQVEQVIAALTK